MLMAPHLHPHAAGWRTQDPRSASRNSAQKINAKHSVRSDNLPQFRHMRKGAASRGAVNRTSRQADSRGKSGTDAFR
jgi:hypothetical protein